MKTLPHPPLQQRKLNRKHLEIILLARRLVSLSLHNQLANIIEIISQCNNAFPFASLQDHHIAAYLVFMTNYYVQS